MRALLLACFEALIPLSAGPGDNIGAFERGPSTELRRTAAVCQPRNKIEGFYLYTDQNTYFQELPAENRSEYYRSVYFELKLADRGPFRCTYSNISVKDFRANVECSILDKNEQPRPFAPKPLKNEEVLPLKTAAAQRISDAVARLQAARGQYENDVKTHAVESEKRTFFKDLAGRMGWQTPAPIPPSKFPLNRALDVCAQVEDEFLGSYVRTARATVRAVPDP